MYLKTKELEWKENYEIRTIDTEDSQGNKITDEGKVLKILII
jgi:hypothetical protein